MDSHLPHDVDSGIRRSLSLPTSCSPGSLSLSEELGEISSGKKLASTGTIPILLFDDDVDDLLKSDSASLWPRFGMANNTRSEEAGNSRSGYQDIQDYSSAILRLGILESPQPLTRGSSRERPEPSSFCGECDFLPNRFHSPLGAALSFDPVDVGGLPSSGSVGDGVDDGRGEEKNLSFVFDVEPARSSRCCRCCGSCRRSSCSRSSSLSRCSNQLGVLHSNPDRTKSVRRNCCGSFCASPAAITTTPLIAAAKQKQNFALETCDPPIGQPSYNSFALYDFLESLQLPLTSNHHDYHLGYQHHDDDGDDACAVLPLAFFSPEADLAIDITPRNRIMDHSFPQPYPSSIEPSSSSSSSNSNIPHHLAWLQDTTISLCIDQEGFRTVSPAFKLVGYTKRGYSGTPSGSPIKQLSELADQASTDPDLAGMAEFLPLKWESFVFHHSPLDPPPSIRRLSVDGDEEKDYLSQLAYLSIKSSSGQVYAVRGSETRRGTGGEDVVSTGRSEVGRGGSPIKFEWRFEYAVEDKRRADGTKVGGGEKFLTPLRFSCSPGLLHSRQSRKVTLFNVWKKGIQPRVTASKLEPLVITSPTTPGKPGHKLAGPLSSPTSPKGLNVGALWFPSAGKLWGKRSKNSPYQFDRGSDGSEEELIPSEGSANRRRRRSGSFHAPRPSRDMGWPSHKWDGDGRGKSADAVWQTIRDVRPSTAGAEGSRGRSRAESFGRGATSEGESSRVLSRSQDGPSSARYGYGRRPRTAR